MRAHRSLCVAFVLVAQTAHLIARAPEGTRGSWYLALHGALSALCLLLWRLGPRHDDEDAEETERRARWTLGTGLLTLALLLPAPPFTTHDVDRYLWDGAVALEGLDPYRTSPDSAPTPLRLLWPTPPEHAAYATLYPPLAIGLFALSALLGGPVLGALWWKLWVTLAAMATLLIGRALLRERRALDALPLIACSPLLLLEAGVGAHLDVLAAASLSLGLLALHRGRPLMAGLGLSAAGMFKLLPAAPALPLLRRRFWVAGRASWLFAGSGLGFVALCYLAALAAGWRPLGSLPLFLERWRFGAPLETLIGPLAGSAGPMGGWVRLGAAVAVMGLTLSFALSRRDPVRAAQWALGGVLLASPTLFPWYLCPLVPLLAAAPSWTLWAAVTAAPLSYEVIDAFDAAGVWAPAEWPGLVVGGALVIGALADRRAEAARSGRPTSSHPRHGRP